jgi:hypothetical protein
MTRGIHLKQLTATNLSLLGLPEELLAAQAQPADPHPLAAEGDPALARITREVRATLEDTLALLDQALALGRHPPHTQGAGPGSDDRARGPSLPRPVTGASQVHPAARPGQP